MNSSNQSWLFISQMVRRELIREWKVLLAALIPVVIGVTVIVTLSALQHAMLGRLGSQEKVLLGSDMSLSLRGKPTLDFVRLSEGIPGERVSEIRFPSMLSVPEFGASSMVEVQGLDGEYPFYGGRETRPAGKGSSYLDPDNILVEESVALHLGLNVGEQVRLGSKLFRISAIVVSSTGQSDIRMSFAPRVIVHSESLQQAGLLGYGVRQRSLMHYKLPQDSNVVGIVERVMPQARAINAELITPQSRRESLSETVARVYDYLSLFALATLILGSLGAISGGALYAARKQRSVATLRCLGASSAELVIAYGLTFFVACLLLSLFGALCSLPLLHFVRGTASQFVPVDLPGTILPSLDGVAQACLLGTLLPLTFALPPIIALRKTSPLGALRAEIEAGASRRSMSLSILIAVSSLVIVLGAVLVGQTKVVTGLGIALFLLIIVHWLVVLLFRRIAVSRLVRSLTFGLRHGIASLKRPGSEAPFLSVLIGIPTFLGVSLWILQSTLVAELDGLLATNDENLVLFDVQPDQRAGLQKLGEEHGVAFSRFYPLVSMRLGAINGESTSMLAQDVINSRKKWYLTREYQNTYRSELVANEVLLEGEMPQRLQGVSLEDSSFVAPITLERRMADVLGVELGDTLQFDVQGLELITSVVGIRKFNFRAINPGFLAVFPEGVLEQAPQFLVVTGKVADLGSFTDYKKELARRFPNVSLIDSREIEAVLDRLFSELSAVISILGSIFLIACIALVFSTVQLSSSARIAERRIYQILGAGKSSIRLMSLAEFFCIGLIGVLAGVVVSLVFILFGLGAYYGLTVSIPGVGLALASTAVILTVTTAGLIGLRVTAAP